MKALGGVWADAAGCYRGALSDRQAVGLQGLTAALPSVYADLIILLRDSTLRRMHGHKLGVSCWWRPRGYMCVCVKVHHCKQDGGQGGCIEIIYFFLSLLLSV